jgi:hypothetical protein
MSCHDNFRKILVSNESMQESFIHILLTKRVQDGCNIEGENGKQGGFYDDACASYRILFIDH